MFDKYLICEDSLRNVVEDGVVIGFEFEVRITSYRGLGLSMVEGFDVTVDGEAYPRKENLFILGGRTFSYDAMETEYEARWRWARKPSYAFRNRAVSLKVRTRSRWLSLFEYRMCQSYQKELTQRFSR